jgi:hypothetical protein
LLRPSRNGPTGALDAIREYAATIDQVARRIEDAIAPPEPPPADPPDGLDRAVA